METAAARFCWTELGTTDAEKAAKFYARLFGWERTPPQLYSSGGNPLDYTLFALGDRFVGGLHSLSGSQRKQGTRSRWIPYVAVTDAAAAAVRASELGAMILVGPLEARGLGHLSILRDPSGALFGTWQSTGLPRDLQAQGEVGFPSWFEHVSENVPGSARFYGALFGWTQPSSASDAGGRLLLEQGGTPVAGFRSRTQASGTLLPQWLTFFQAEDCAASCQKMTALHGSVISAPSDASDSTRVAVASDPQGAVFGLMTPVKR